MNTALSGIGMKPRPHPSLGRQLDLQHGDALIVVDMQRDFLPGGRLAVAEADGGDIVARLNAYIDAFDARALPIFLTRDWHPENHCSFQAAGGRWPAHCVQATLGAQWAEGLHVPRSARIVSKGTDAELEAYSGFSGTSLLPLLRELAVRRLFVGGVATDYCVHATVMDARTHGFEVTVLADAIAGVNAAPADVTRAISEMLARGATLLQRAHAAPDAMAAAGRELEAAHDTAGYGFGKEVALPFAAAIERVTELLQGEGFGILSDIDVRAALQKKLGIQMPAYRILGACNPPLAYQALQAEPSIGLLLPCNVVVREDALGKVHVECLDPNVLAMLVDHPAVADLSAQVRKKLVRAMDSL